MKKINRFLVRFCNGDTFLIAVVLLLLLALFSLINPNFLSGYNLVSLAQSLAPYAILSMGVMFVIGTGGTDLSVGAVCIGASVFAGTLCRCGMPFALSIPVMLLFGGVMGYINGYLVAMKKIPSFIATLGSMMFVRGFTALLANRPNIFYPSGSWFNTLFSTYEGTPIGFLWVLLFGLLVGFLIHRHKAGRYILSIGSNEEAARLSGIHVARYKCLAYVLSGLFAGLAAVFWSASFATISVATGNGMELDAIAGVYIGGSSATGGVVNVTGGILGAILLIVIRSGLNFALAKFNLNLNSTYVTYVLTGVIVVIAVLLDQQKNKQSRQSAEMQRIPGAKLAFMAVSLIVCLIAAVMNFGAIRGVSGKSSNKEIALLAKSEDNGFWRAVIKGAKAAGEEFGYTVRCRGPESEDPAFLPQQRELMQTLLSQYPHGLGIAMIADGFSDLLEQAYDMGIPLVEYDNGLWGQDRENMMASSKNPLKAFVKSQVYDMASACGEKFYDCIKRDVAASGQPYVIGVIQFEANQTAARRAQGFIDGITKKLNETPATRGKFRIVNEIKPSPTNNAYKEALEALYEKGASAIFMTNEVVVNQVYDAIAAAGDKYDRIVFCGFDAGSKQIDWLKADKPPRLVGSCSQNPFNLGYMTAKTLIELAEGKEVAKEVPVQGYWYTKENVDELLPKGVVYRDAQ